MIVSGGRSASEERFLVDEFELYGVVSTELLEVGIPHREARRVGFDRILEVARGAPKQVRHQMVPHVAGWLEHYGRPGDADVWSVHEECWRYAKECGSGHGGQNFLNPFCIAGIRMMGQRSVDAPRASGATVAILSKSAMTPVRWSSNEQIRKEGHGGLWVATDVETDVTNQGKSRDAALTNPDEAEVPHNDEIGREPTDWELRELGIDPADNTTESQEPPDVLE